MVPVFLLIVFGSVDFGQAVVLYNMASESARDGARAAQVLITPAEAAAASVPTATQTQIRTAARAKVGSYGPRLSVSPTTGGDASDGYYVRVRVTAAYQPAVARLLGINTVNVAASSQLFLP